MKNMGKFVLTLLMLIGPIPGFSQFTPQEISEHPNWEDFLQNARIIDRRQLSAENAVTRPWVLTLEKDGMTHRAIWKNVEGLKNGYQEGWKWEIAAYKLDRYLGLHMIPPTVEKRYWGKSGSCQLWVEDATCLYKKLEQNQADRFLRKLEIHRALWLQRAFDNLIANEDRHQGNYLVTQDDRIILIDHSRTFRTSKKFTKNLIYTEKHEDGPLVMRQLPRDFVDKLEDLNFEILKSIVGPYLTNREIQGVLIRRDMILEEIRRLMDLYGEENVLYR